MKAMVLPSGDHLAERPPRESVDMRRASPPAALTSQRSCLRRLAARSVVTTVYTTCLPSGEIAGSVTRSRVRNSLTDIACRPWAWSGAVARIRARLQAAVRMAVLVMRYGNVLDGKTVRR